MRHEREPQELQIRGCSWCGCAVAVDKWFVGPAFCSKECQDAANAARPQRAALSLQEMEFVDMRPLVMMTGLAFLRAARANGKTAMTARLFGGCDCDYCRAARGEDEGEH